MAAVWNHGLSLLLGQKELISLQRTFALLPKILHVTGISKLYTLMVLLVVK